MSYNNIFIYTTGKEWSGERVKDERKMSPYNYERGVAV